MRTGNFDPKRALGLNLHVVEIGARSRASVPLAPLGCPPASAAGRAGFETDNALKLILEASLAQVKGRAALGRGPMRTMNDVGNIHIVDDDPGVSEALALFLETEGYSVRAHESARVFLDSIGSDENGCVVTDMRMPGMTGLELMQAMKERRISMPIILVTAYADVPLALQAMKMGAVDLLEKPFEYEALLTAIRDALQRAYADETRRAKTRAILKRFASLTKREKEVFAEILKGRPNKLIAHDLGISMRTVEVHRGALMIKMGAKNLPELVQLAIVIPPTELPMTPE
jgi:two-component system response regulator FixJ